MRYIFLVVLILSLCASATKAQQCNANIIRATPTGNFDLSGDIATDKSTGLQWRRCAEGQSWQSGGCTGDAATYTWNDAQSKFATPDSAGWRLPNIKELASIAELACWEPAINLTIFPGTAASGFWSASAVASGSTGAWLLAFGGGYDGWDGRSHAYSVRLVRGGQ